jgi:hypothetical protein
MRGTRWRNARSNPIGSSAWRAPPSGAIRTRIGQASNDAFHPGRLNDGHAPASSGRSASGEAGRRGAFFSPPCIWGRCGMASMTARGAAMAEPSAVVILPPSRGVRRAPLRRRCAARGVPPPPSVAAARRHLPPTFVGWRMGGGLDGRSRFTTCRARASVRGRAASPRYGTRARSRGGLGGRPRGPASAPLARRVRARG